MANFCGKCGSKLDATTGKCPNCDKQSETPVSPKADIPIAKPSNNPTNEEPKNNIKNDSDKNNADLTPKQAKKAAKKEKKKAKRAQMSFGKRVKKFFLKLLAVVLALAIVGCVGICTLVYFEKVDIPFIERVLYKFGITREINNEEEIAKKIEELNNYNPGEEVRKESKVLETIEATSSNQIVIESDAVKQFKERGFSDSDIVTTYAMDGTYFDERVIDSNSQEKHPLYTSEYITPSGFQWEIYCSNGEWAAVPVSYLYSEASSVEVIVSETDYLVSYDSMTNSFYKIIPNDSLGKISTVQRIDATTLNALAEKEFKVS